MGNFIILSVLQQLMIIELVEGGAARMNELSIRVTQLPKISNNVQEIKDWADGILAEAQSMVYTEESIQGAKLYRATIRRYKEEINKGLRDAKDKILTPFYILRALCDESVLNALDQADATLKNGIDGYDNEIKQRCEDSLREYFDELCAAHGIDWLKYEQVGIKVDMASAKQKTPKKLREQLVIFVVNVAKDIETIDGIENAEEILAEYKLTLNFPDAFRIVQERHQRIDAEVQAKEERKAAREAQAEAIRKIEALAPPTAQELLTRTFTVTDTKERLIALREWMKANGYKYE